MSCNWPDDFEIAPNVTYGSFEPISEVCPATYIRPDPGGSMMPWLPTLLLLFFHLPACIIRAVRWESAQYLALGLALLGVALSIQAYVSTGLKPEEVLVWMPLTLVLDAGAMEQLIVLIIEKHDERRPWVQRRKGKPMRRGGRVLWDAVVKAWKETRQKMAQNLLPGHRAERIPAEEEVEMEDRRDAERGDEQQANSQHDANAPEEPLVAPVANPPAAPAPVNVDANVEAAAREEDNNDDLEAAENEEHEDDDEEEEENDPHPDALRYFFVALAAALLLLALLTLQIYALYYSITGLQSKNLTVNWCSPAFRDFALAVTTGNCQLYPVLPSSSNGIGCIALPATQQRDFLRGTAIFLSCALFCQTSDWILMMCTNSKSRWRGVKFQRPWLTMAVGIIVLVVLVYAGRINADELPKGVTRTVWIYRKEESRVMGRVCRGELSPPGLRGTMIGYMDGLFESWGEVYDGH